MNTHNYLGVMTTDLHSDNTT